MLGAPLRLWNYKDIVTTKNTVTLGDMVTLGVTETLEDTVMLGTW